MEKRIVSVLWSLFGTFFIFMGIVAIFYHQWQLAFSELGIAIIWIFLD